MQEEESTPAFQRWLEYRSRAPSQDAKLASVYCCNVYLLSNLTLIGNPALISSNHPKASSEIFFSAMKSSDSKSGVSQRDRLGFEETVIISLFKADGV